MALLDLQAMQPSAPAQGGDAGSTSSAGCGVASTGSVLLCGGVATSSLSLSVCH